MSPTTTLECATLSSIVSRGLDAVKSADQTRPQMRPIEPLPSEPGAWAINLGNAFSYLEKIALVVDAGDAGDRTVALTVGEPAVNGCDLRFHSPGVYVVRLPAGSKPRSLECDVTDVSGGSESQRRLEQ